MMPQVMRENASQAGARDRALAGVIIRLKI
jgi:hypothetical protein